MIACRINGQSRRLDAHPMKRVLDVLREDLGLTGTKEGCGEGECGACTVLLDGVPVNSCIVPAAHLDGVSLTTIEGLADGDRLHPLQEAFVTEGGAQCGICTPGMILAALSIPRAAKTAAIQEALAGNLCRCTGYEAIYRSVRRGARRRGQGRYGGQAGLSAVAQGESGAEADRASTARRASGARNARKRDR